MWDDFVLFVAVGFAAQLVDGAIGMAYGLSATTVMLSFGIPPATASASVHAAEVFTTGISGFSHWRFGNVDWAFVRKLALPGMLGGAVGAYVLTTLPGDAVAPFVSAYLLLMGAWILWKAYRSDRPPRPSRRAGSCRSAWAAASSTRSAAAAGGRWSPRPCWATARRRGSRSARSTCAEFFVTVTISVTFLGTIGLELWPIIAGLILGGALAAPVAAYAAKAIPDRPLMILVGSVIVLLSIRGLIRAMG